LKQSASQMAALSHTLPFLIADWIEDSDDDEVYTRLQNFVLLLQITFVLYLS